MTLRTDELDYDLPDALIAQEPATPRDSSRLLVLHRTSGKVEHRRFADLPDYLAAGDCLVLNNTQVIKARLFGRRETGGKVELLLVRPAGPDLWEALCRPAARLTPGTRVHLEGEAVAAIVAAGAEGRRTIKIEGVDPVEVYLSKHGHVPLPPYIARTDRQDDVARYQTVYARTPGAVAAPTAGLHFTEGLLDQLAGRGVERAEITLHVGPGTFRPISTPEVGEHKLDPEWFSVASESAQRIRETRAAGGRVVAVGTTSVRVLETLARAPSGMTDCEGWADLYIAPPFQFRTVDAMITNFHLPRSSLLALVAAFAGLSAVRAAYRTAVSERYRFYSYGDAMLIL